MSLKCWLAAVACSVAVFSWAGQQGTVPKASAEKYAAHAENNGAKIGVARLSSGQLSKTFSLDKLSTRDLEENCVVVEVGLYPAKDAALEVSPESFALRVPGRESAVTAASPTTAVAAIPYYVQVGDTGGGGGGGIMSAPRPQLDSTTGINRDPVTGLPRRSVGITPPGTNVGAGVGGSGQPDQPPLPPERRELAAKMTDKGLQQGKISAPAAGYIYFPVETQKGEKYQLEYTLNGKTVMLPL